MVSLDWCNREPGIVVASRGLLSSALPGITLRRRIIVGSYNVAYEPVTDDILTRQLDGFNSRYAIQSPDRIHESRSDVVRKVVLSRVASHDDA